MAVKGITIDTLAAADPHILAYDAAIINNSLTGGDAVHEMFSNLLATKVSNNIVTIAPGVFSIQGHFAYVTYGTTESMTIENGTSGQKRNDLICAKFKRTLTTDEITIVVVKGTNNATTPVDPTIVQQDLLTGGTERLFPLWRVSIDGLNITTLTQLFTTQKNLNVFKDSFLPVTSGAFTKQDINGFRTVTYSATITLNISGAVNGVYADGAGITLPVGFRFSSSEDIKISTLNAAIISTSQVSYTRSSGNIVFYVYSHVALGSVNVIVSMLATGKI